MAEAPILTVAFDSWVRRWVLALTLVLCCVIGLITPYLLAITAIVLFLALVLRGRLVTAYRNPAALLFLVAFLVLGVCFALTAKAPQDVLLIFNFIMLVLFAPLFALMQIGAARNNTVHVARLALAGAAVGLVVAFFARYGLSDPRGQTPNFGAILLGNTAVLLGFLALTGVIADKGGRRWLYVLGPLCGIAATFATESRGPLLAMLPLTLVAAIFISRRLRLGPLWIGLGAAVVLAAIAIAALMFEGRVGTVFAIAGDLASGNAIEDETTRIRLILYEAGLQAFLQSPWLGHGWANLMSSVRPFLAPEHQQFAILPQLHNDIADFAVAAGFVGIATYLLLIVTPIIAALRSPRDSQYALRLFGCVTLAVAYVFDGITDLMFGFEFHTALYVCVTAILLGYCRDGQVGGAR